MSEPTAADKIAEKTADAMGQAAARVISALVAGNVTLDTLECQSMIMLAFAGLRLAGNSEEKVADWCKAYWEGVDFLADMAQFKANPNRASVH